MKFRLIAAVLLASIIAALYLVFASPTAHLPDGRPAAGDYEKYRIGTP